MKRKQKMLNLDNIKYKNFKVGNLFLVEKCKCNKAGDLKIGNIPYIGATNRNNGLMSFVNKENKLISQGNCIAFICDGQGSVGYSIYKYENFIGSTTLKVGRNSKLNKFNGLFLTSALDKNKSIYDYGYKRNDIRLKNEQIILPVNEDEEPDYNHMEEYSKSIINSKTEKYKQYAQKVLNSIEYKNIETLENKEWENFFLIDIFTTIQRGKRLTKQNQTKGNIPYISSTSLNNGVDNFIGNKTDVRIFSDCLTIANSGSVGASFYQPYNFVGSDHITHLKKENMNKYVYIFISTLTNRFSEKYNFNREINDKRISREKIMLPINDRKEPDFQYMEQYMKNLTYKKVNQYLSFINYDNLKLSLI
ncbi:restriction endonuclease subunit S [Aliarcobacter butzleri]|uniref:restriction endonuclease subunit S n=1 Tax=Aliarcobacter butzleri TaxID=28197 RepID=UPI00126048FF|nr:restriction endonuclease subunit S [Aliarcobacter butzleri]